MTFLQKSYSKVEKSVLVTMSYVGLDDEEELKTVSVINKHNNNYNVVSDSKSESNYKKKENLFDEDIDNKVKVTPKITSVLKWLVH